jgi:hypothetical protein
MTEPVFDSVPPAITGPVILVNMGMLAAETLRGLVEHGFDVSQHADRWGLPDPRRAKT